MNSYFSKIPKMSSSFIIRYSTPETLTSVPAYFPKNTWSKLHLQIIFYGREFSPARSPKKELDYITSTIGTKKALQELK